MHGTAHHGAMFNFLRRHHKEPPEKKMTSADLVEALGLSSFSSSGQMVTVDRAMQVATVYACVRILAESIAQLPAKIYKRNNENGNDILSNGPLWQLVQFPNSWQNSFEFFEYAMLCLCLRGNFFAVKNVRRGEVIELLPLRPDAVSVQRENWELFYTYTDATGRSQTVGSDAILHIRGFSLDGIIGLSPIAYMRNSIGLAMSTEAHGARVFKNGGRPGGVLTHPGKLSDEALRHLEMSWSAAHGGENSGGTAILEEGLTYAPIAMTNEDAQYLEARQFQRTEICSIFRIPPHMIGDLTKSSFSNITQQSLEFVKYSVLPWCKRIETAIWRSLLTEKQRADGVYIEFLLDGLERADIKTRYESYQIAINSGILSSNECRKLENRNPREGGDDYLQPLNMTGNAGGGSAPEEGQGNGNETTV